MTARSRCLLLALLVTAVALTGCTSGGSSDSSGASGAALSASPPEAAAALGTAPRTASAPRAAGLDLGRDVVRTATQGVEVADVRAAAERARTLAEGSGGGLEGEDAADGRDALRLRVAPDRVTATLDSFAALGRETARTVGSTDVTEQVADLGSRVASQRASVERVRALLAGARALSDVVTIEGELSRRESDLESLQARAAALQGSADLASVTLTLTARPAEAAVVPPQTEAGFGSGLAAGLDALVGTARVLAVVGGALLPFLPLLLLAGWLVRRSLRRPVPAS